jgi:dolichol-phosphate mannosyltransferase
MTDAPFDRSVRKDVPLLSVVVPMYNEQAVVEMTHRTLIETLGSHDDFEIEIVYVNDGSSDSTEEILLSLAAQEPRATVVCFSRNFGHQPAVTAGLAHARGDVVAVIDGDLQDPPSMIVEMLAQWRLGYDVIYGVRTQRKEGPFHRFAYAAFYRIYKQIAEIEVPLDSGDFALMDRAVVEVINALPEKNRFVRGLRCWAGFRHYGLVYERHARAAGETKYPLRKLARLAFDGVFNFSGVPLEAIFWLGIASALVAGFAFVVLLTQRILEFKILGWGFQEIPGFTTMALTLLLFSGIQLASIGILGEYIGRIYQEVKARPAYVVRQVFQARPKS